MYRYHEIVPFVTLAAAHPCARPPRVTRVALRCLAPTRDPGSTGRSFDLRPYTLALPSILSRECYGAVRSSTRSRRRKRETGGRSKCSRSGAPRRDVHRTVRCTLLGNCSGGSTIYPHAVERLLVTWSGGQPRGVPPGVGAFKSTTLRLLQPFERPAETAARAWRQRRPG